MAVSLRVKCARKRRIGGGSRVRRACADAGAAAFALRRLWSHSSAADANSIARWAFACCLPVRSPHRPPAYSS